MRWRALVLCLCVFLAGCASAPPAESPTTPHPECVTTPDYEKRAVPARPTNLTNESAKQFAITHAEALVWNDKYRDAGTGLAVNVYQSIVNETDDGYLVYVAGGMTYYTCENGNLGVADGGFHATYFINNSTALKLNRPTNRTDDPREHGGEPIA